MTGPVERKVKASAATAAVTGVIVWALTSFVPAFEAGLPDAVYGLLTWLVPAVLAVASGYLASHTDRTDPDSQR